jgi:uncharacterized membrane protein YgcG
MKRLCLFLAITLSSLSVTLFFVPSRANADVNDFHFSSFDADYYLSKDSEGHSTMKVVERLTAEFVNVDQNRGIERAIPKFYDGHSVSFRFISMKRNGVEEPLYEQRNESQFVVLSTRRNDYVNGTQVYEFTYVLRDVTKDFGGHQELYWDTNGTGWAQSFDSVTARVHLGNSVSGDFTGDVSCYRGLEGSKNSCSYDSIGQKPVSCLKEGSKTSCVYDSSGQVISFSSGGPLYAHENLTVDLSFKSGTFAGYQLTFLDIVPYILVALALLCLVVAIIIKVRFGRNYPGRGTIVPEYLPPKGVSVLLAAEISGDSTTASTAQILDLAVRHKIRVIESDTKVLFIKVKKYTLELLNIDGLNDDELSFVKILFGSKDIGSKYDMSKTDRGVGLAILEKSKDISKEAEALGYRSRNKQQIILQKSIITAVIILIVAAFYISLTNNNVAGVISSVVAGFVFILLLIVARIESMRPLTPEGRELYDYLKGLKMYIQLAEVDRIKVLQSPQGAEKESIDTNDPAKMVVLYERVLPYAVLFGQETEWLKQLGNYYESTQSSPDWYSGVSAFNAASFASSVSSFSSYSASSSSSSSSGAGGGGSSGGGGGGGGGGGV